MSFWCVANKLSKTPWIWHRQRSKPVGVNKWLAHKCASIFVNNQPDAQFFFMYVYFYSLHVSGSHVPIIRRINCINTTSGICHSVQMTVWCAGLDETAEQSHPNLLLYLHQTSNHEWPLNRYSCWYSLLAYTTNKIKDPLNEEMKVTILVSQSNSCIIYTSKHTHFNT
jgi:hypothetical protein